MGLATTAGSYNYISADAALAYRRITHLRGQRFGLGKTPDVKALLIPVPYQRAACVGPHVRPDKAAMGPVSTTHC